MKLKKYIDTYGIDHRSFYEKCKISSKSFYLYMKGKRKPYIETAKRISEATNNVVTIQDLRGYGTTKTDS